MSAVLRALRLGLLAIAAMAVGCGGGGNDSGDGAPVISNLRYSPSTVAMVPGGTTTLTGTIDFSDTGRNIERLRLAVSNGANLAVPVPLPGVGSGTLIGDFLVSTSVVGHFTFEVWLEDSAGQASNHLTGTLDVVLDDSATSWRLIPAPQSLTAALQLQDVLDIVWTGSGYVAVGNQGLALSTPDLVSWTRSPGLTPLDLRSVAWSGSVFVAVGNDSQGKAAVLRSTDGVTWTVQYEAGDCLGTDPPFCRNATALPKVIWAGSQFVVAGRETIVGSGAGDYAVFLTSADGLSWTKRAAGALPVGGNEGVGVGSVAWSGTMLVAAGQARDGSAGIWTSTDASAWIARPTPWGPAQHVLRDVTWARGRFVAVGWGGMPATATSTDGITWQANQDAQSQVATNAVVAGPNVFLALHPIYKYTSTDGLLWTALPFGAPGGCPNSKPVWDGSRWVAIGTSGVCLSP